MRYRHSDQARDRFHHLIPGGAHTYAKGDDQWPATAAPIMAGGQGCRVIDLDGNEYIEYGSGLRAVTLGHAYPPVAEAVTRALLQGSNFVRPAILELEAAERFLSLVPTLDMVKFAKNGSDVTTAAVRLARAATGRDLVAACRDHPFFSTDDWFIGTTPMPAGVPSALSDLTIGFGYNDIAGVEQLFADRGDDLAAVILEVERTDPPLDGFLQRLRALCDRYGVVLVFDEIVTGFRWHNGGAHALHGVVPDLAAFGKGIANGFPLAALAGGRELMELGGTRHDGERVFLLSTTYGADSVGLTAGIATMDVYEKEPVVEHLHWAGKMLAERVTAAAAGRQLTEQFQVVGRECCLLFVTRDSSGASSQWFRTLFLQECVDRGLLAPSFVVNYSHDEDVIDRTTEIVDAALGVYASALADGVEHHLRGRPVQPVFRPRNDRT